MTMDLQYLYLLFWWLKIFLIFFCSGWTFQWIRSNTKRLKWVLHAYRLVFFYIVIYKYEKILHLLILRKEYKITVCEIIIYILNHRQRCLKYHIRGERKGSVEKFIDLPGPPDNILLDGEGHYWIALAMVIAFFFYYLSQI